MRWSNRKLGTCLHKSPNEAWEGGAKKPPVKPLHAWDHWEHGQVASSTSPKSWCCCPHWAEERLSCVRPAAALEKTEGSNWGIQAAADLMEQQHQGELCANSTSNSFPLLQR